MYEVTIGAVPDFTCLAGGVASAARTEALPVIVTPAVNPRFIELLRFDIQSTGQKSRCVNTLRGPSQRFVLIRQSDSLSPCQF